LFLLPALLGQGLMTIKETHTIKEGYYKLESIILTLAFMILCRIKNPEQLKQCAPGEMGKLIGLDRIPEIKCLRNKIADLFANKTTAQLNQKLAVQWNETTAENLVLYTDGHVKIYTGNKANLTKKFVSRQKLCLSATTDFWLHDAQGLPLMVWTGELSEKLQYMIEHSMIPALLSSGMIAKQDKDQNQKPVCTLVFDREAYEPQFFTRLWDKYRIAIITYRKHVKDQWDVKDFTEVNVLDTLNNKKTMQLAEKPIELNGCKFREIRCLASREHQTALITTHPTLDMATTALTLFNRWQQENFFKYMLADYSLDHLVAYGTEPIDLASKIVNPAYRVINYQLKKEREKLQRLKATLLKKVNLNTTEQLDQFKESIETKANLLIQIEAKQKVVEQLLINRNKIPAKITLRELPEEKRYTKLKTESAYFMSTLKMICYRAESALANLLQGGYAKFTEEKRMFIKNIITTPADLIPDFTNNTLTIKLHSLNTPNANQLLSQICKTLNESETKYPGTNLTMIYKSVLN
jgi:ribosomal protein S10